MKKILVTGSAGFIFSNFMRMAMEEKLPYSFVSIDKVIAPYNIPHIKLNSDHQFYLGDIADEKFISNIFNIEKPDIIIHGAAESFVDDSIKSAKPFIHSNVAGTQVLIDEAVKHNVQNFIMISTDEIYGQLKSEDASWTENSTPSPRNPYSATKLCSELIVKAAHETHGLQYNVTRCCNNFGPRQPPRNLVPKIINCLINNKPIPIHGSGKNLREWISAYDHSKAIITILEKGIINETYNIGSGSELQNLEMVELISTILNIKPNIQFIKDRAGHDFRYSLNYDKLKKLGWISTDFHKNMENCVQWYLNNKWFLDLTTNLF